MFSKKHGTMGRYKKQHSLFIGMKKDLENLDKYLLDAIENINNDRAVTKMLLLDVIELIKKTKENHKDSSNLLRSK